MENSSVPSSAPASPIEQRGLEYTGVAKAIASSSPFSVKSFTEQRVEKFSEDKWVRIDSSLKIDDQINAWVEESRNQIVDVSVASAGLSVSDHATRYTVHNAMVTYMDVSRWVELQVNFLAAAIFKSLPEDISRAFMTSLVKGGIAPTTTSATLTEAEIKAQMDAASL